ncbi:MAG: methyltransferase [Pseudomonadota bacterium]
MSGWRRRWVAIRNAFLTNDRFQRWAAMFPPTRGFARGDAERLFDIMGGFVYSQTTLAFVQSGLLDRVASGPASVHELAGVSDLSEAAARRLARAAAALDLTEEVSPDVYALGRLGAAMRADPSLAAMARHNGEFYFDLSDPLALLRGSAQQLRMPRYWGYAGNPEAAELTPEQAKAYSDLMAGTQKMVAEEVLAAYPIRRHRKLLDVGGGAGAFAAAAMTRAPDLSASVFDLPAVATLARGRFEESGFGGRGSAIGGDFFNSPLPEGFDLVSLVRVLHDHDDEPAMALLRRIREALPKGGTLLIGEPMSDGAGARRIGDAYFGFYLLAMGSGRARRSGEIRGMLRAAGFAKTRKWRTNLPLVASVVTAS